MGLAVIFNIGILALILLAAWHDVASRTIPDTISLLVLVVGTLLRSLEGPSALALSAATSLLLFTVLLIAFSRRLIGGGDVKIMTAAAVGLSPLDCYRFVIATTIAGGFLAITYLVLSRTLTGLPARRTSLFGRVAAIESWRIRRCGSIPYGVAIAAGGAFVLLLPRSS